MQKRKRVAQKPRKRGNKQIIANIIVVGLWLQPPWDTLQGTGTPALMNPKDGGPWGATL